MAVINIVGFETGDELETSAVNGTRSVQSSVKRTGTYALRCNPAASTAGYFGISAYTAVGGVTAINRTAQTYYTFYFRFASLPSGTVQFASVGASTTAPLVRLDCTSGGVITMVGATTSATIATITAGVWYRAELRVTTNASSGCMIDGGAEQTCTANNQTANNLYMGRTIATEAVAFDCYYDDAYISDSTASGKGEVRILLPITGAGAYSGWTNGPGTDDYQDVDEVPHDSDTTYIGASAAQDNAAHTFNMTSTATAGVIGTVAALRLMTIVRADSTAGTSAIGARLRSSTTDSDTTGAESFTSYASRPLNKMFSVDPATSAAWTLSGVDGIEAGVFAGTLAQAQRCTAVYVMVWSTGIFNATTVLNAPNADFTATASSTVPTYTATANNLPAGPTSSTSTVQTLFSVSCTSTVTVGATTSTATSSHNDPDYTATTTTLLVGPTTSVATATFTGLTYTATSVLLVGSATSQSTATHDDPDYTATAALNAKGATSTAIATHNDPDYTATVALLSGGADFASTMTFGIQYTGTASPLTGPTSFVASATHNDPDYIATAAPSIGGATSLSSVTYTDPSYTASAIMQSGATLHSSILTHNDPDYTATATLNAPNADFTASMLFAGSIYNSSAALTTGGQDITVAGNAFPVYSSSAILTTGGQDFNAVANALPVYSGIIVVENTGSLFTGVATHNDPDFTCTLNSTFPAAILSASGVAASELFILSGVFTVGGTEFDAVGVFKAPALIGRQVINVKVTPRQRIEFEP